MAASTATAMKKKPAFRRLHALIQEPGPHPLIWYHRVGEQVQRLCPRGTRQYGRSAVATLVGALNKPEPYSVQLWAARTFNGAYTRDEVQDLSIAAPGSNYTLRWSHMLHLLSLDTKDRRKFQRRCIKERWSARELHRRIKDYRGQKGHGGRQYDAPQTLEAALSQLVHETEAWRRRYHGVWFPEGGIIKTAGRSSAGTAAERKLLDEAIAALERIQGALPNDLERLREIRGGWGGGIGR